MVQKRSLGVDLYEVSSKQPRHLKPGDEMVSSLHFPDENVAPMHHNLGEGRNFHLKSKPECIERHESCNLGELQTCTDKEIDTNALGFSSNSSRAMSTTSEEDIRSEGPSHTLQSPDYYNLDYPVRTIVYPGDIYSCLLEYPPRKLVPVGRDFQAEIPEWGVNGSENMLSSSRDTCDGLNQSSQTLDLTTCNESNDKIKLAGTCVIPMPELDVLENNVERLGGGRMDCSCRDMGSIRCVQEHIREARENLRKTLGQETFVEMGFCDMGEVVAEKWSEVEEQIFHEVVFTNPLALGKNFWDHLAVEFPSRTKKEIVSYYFNVFMLRKRAEQNRFDPLNVDSDNDEWDATDDSSDGVIERINGNDDSAVESPVYEDDFDHNGIYEGNELEHAEGVTHETTGDHAHVNCSGNEGVIRNVPEISCNDSYGSDPTFKNIDKVLLNEPVGHHVQDGPSVAHDTGIAPEVVSEKANSGKHWMGSPSLMSSSGGHELLLEPCSSKEWDGGYLTCPKNEDFLPTRSMIEEVFGTGAWNYKTSDC